MKKVFQAHPKAKELFVVKGMPFLKEMDAEKHCDDLKISYDEIEVIAKGGKKAPSENSEGSGDDSKTPLVDKIIDKVKEGMAAKNTEDKKVKAKSAAKKTAAKKVTTRKPAAKKAADKKVKADAVVTKKAAGEKVDADAPSAENAE